MTPIRNRVAAIALSMGFGHVVVALLVTALHLFRLLERGIRDFIG